MQITIDGAGRVVIPSDVRRRLGLHAGSLLELHVDDDCVRLEPAVPTATVAEDDGVLVVRRAAGAAPSPSLSTADVRAILEEVRDGGR